MKTVRTPEPGHTGFVGSVQFVDGVATVADDAQELLYLRAAGYTVEEVEEAGDEPKSTRRRGARTEGEPQ